MVFPRERISGFTQNLLHLEGFFPDNFLKLILSERSLPCLMESFQVSKFFLPVISRYVL